MLKSLSTCHTSTFCFTPSIRVLEASKHFSPRPRRFLIVLDGRGVSNRISTAEPEMQRGKYKYQQSMMQETVQCGWEGREEMDCIHSVREYYMRTSVLTPEATTAASIPRAPVNTGSFSRAHAPVKLERREYCFNSSFLTTDHINHSYVFSEVNVFFF